MTFQEMGSFALGNSWLLQKINKRDIIVKSIFTENNKLIGHEQRQRHQQGSLMWWNRHQKTRQLISAN